MAKLISLDGTVTTVKDAGRVATLLSRGYRLADAPKPVAEPVEVLEPAEPVKKAPVKKRAKKAGI
jgi:hypothetical protein